MNRILQGFFGDMITMAPHPKALWEKAESCELQKQPRKEVQVMESNLIGT